MLHVHLEAPHLQLYCAATFSLSAECTMLQVLHVLLEDLRMDYKYSEATQSARFAINSMQLDNQLLTSTHPVVLAPSSSGEPA